MILKRKISIFFPFELSPRKISALVFGKRHFPRISEKVIQGFKISHLITSRKAHEASTPNLLARHHFVLAVILSDGPDRILRARRCRNCWFCASKRPNFRPRRVSYFTGGNFQIGFFSRKMMIFLFLGPH